VVSIVYGCGEIGEWWERQRIDGRYGRVAGEVSVAEVEAAGTSKGRRGGDYVMTYGICITICAQNITIEQSLGVRDWMTVLVRDDE
jgi:hypothetical protein